MNYKITVAIGVIFTLFLAETARAQTSLAVTYGAKGVQTVSFQGVVLEDTGQFPGDVFHIWHIKTTDLLGNVTSSGQYGWGEANNAEVWNAATNTETYTFVWGSIATQFIQNGNNLDMVVTETNNAGSGAILDGAQIYPLALHFPRDPVNFYGYTQFAITTTGPGVSVADYGAGTVTSVIPNESLALYGGWQNLGTNTYAPSMTTTAPDGLAPFFPHNDVPVMPGNSLTYTVSLRFTPEGVQAAATDAYSSFAAKYPSQMTWKDKRIIGTAYLSSSPPSNGDASQPGGFPTNPRRYFNDASVDITSASGLQSFQDRVLAQAALNVTTAQTMNAQGVITWDIEGEQYPQNTSYVCSPDQIATVAPEMESVITDRGSAHFGQKLDDAYFAALSAAGLKVGVCLRPQVYTLYPNGTAGQIYLAASSAIVANLEAKARYANSRWGATIFYVDSNVDTYGGTLDPAIYQQLITDLPGFLFIPEENTPRYYAYTAPFYSFFAQNSMGTPVSTYNFYPAAFGANLINDVSASTLAAYQPQLTQSVARGDILMGHADWFQPNDPTLIAIYAAAGATVPPPVQGTPSISWSTPSPIAYGTPLSNGQLNATSNVPGTFTYTPAAGTTPSAGTSTLLVTFTPTDAKDYKSVTTSVSLTVLPVSPVLSWPVPAPIASGTALSTAQLNATANVPGTFVYSPPSGSVLSAGTYPLSVTFMPADITDYKITTASVPITVTSSAIAPVITWPGPSPITYATPLSATQLNAMANVPGSFTYSPAAGAVLNAGAQTLSVTFIPANLTTYKTTTASVILVVQQAATAITWAAPAPISSGTALSPAQLNASVNVPGSFVYSPAAGTVLSAGTQVLSVKFTPSDSTDYKVSAASVSIVVTPPVAFTITWATPASISYGTPLSVAQLNAAGPVPGSFTYNPPAGTVLHAGVQTLRVTFTPSGSANYTPTSAAVSLTVVPATPVIAWSPPAAVASGTTLSNSQLNATANVPGSFSYSPSAGTLLSPGTYTLSVTFSAADSADYSTVSASVPFTVTPLTVIPTGPTVNLSILSPIAGSTISGSITVLGQLNTANLHLDSAGTFLMVDGVEVGTRRVIDPPYLYPLDTTTLTNGLHILQLWAHDIGNNTTISAAVPVTVQN